MDVQQKGKMVAKIVSIVSKIQEPIPGRRVFVQVFDKREEKMLCSMILGRGRKNNGFDFEKRAINWLKTNNNVFTSAESKDAFIAGVGAVSGCDYIISVSGGFPKDNSALAVILLAEFENEPTCMINCNAYLTRAQCKSEYDSLLEYLSKELGHDFFNIMTN